MNKLRIEWYYQLPKGSNTYWMKTELLSVFDALRLEEDLIRTGRAKTIEFFDEKDERWTRKEISAFLKNLETEPHDVIAYIDGGFNLETKNAGLGIVIYYKQNGQHWRYRVNEQIHSMETNNEAEFAALAYLLNTCEGLGISHQQITVHTDSRTLYHQATGEWPSYEKELVDWLDRVDTRIKTLGLDIQYELISRHQNKEADQLASQALSAIFIEGTSEKRRKSD